jgi:porin
VRLDHLSLALVSVALPFAAAAQGDASLTGGRTGLGQALGNAGVQLQLQEQSEVWGNLSGGLRRGVVYDGLTTASVAVDLAKLANWTGATFFVSGYQIHGRGPSANLVGNLQLVSNLEATRDTKLYDLWLEQNLLGGRLNVRLGQEGANDEFMIADYSAVFLNASFGFPALPATDLPSGGPNYPLATPFVRARYQSDQITLMGAVYNGDPAPPGSGDPQRRDAGGTAFRLNDHALIFAELWYSPDKATTRATDLLSTYKLGAWYYSGPVADQLFDTAGLSLADPATAGVPRQHSRNYALYGIIDQILWRKPANENQGIGAFLLLMGAPDDRNFSNLAIAGGVNWKGPFEGRDADVFGVAFSYQGIGGAARRRSRDVAVLTGIGSSLRSNETVVEATYLYQAAPWWTLQPDIQYVINPGAGIPGGSSRKPLKNATIVGVRTQITF